MQKGATDYKWIVITIFDDIPKIITKKGKIVWEIENNNKNGKNVLFLL